MFHPESELSSDAARLASYARMINGDAGLLAARPDLAYRVLEGLKETIRNLDGVIEQAAASYFTHSHTAVTEHGDEIAGSKRALRTGGYLAASADMVRTLAALLMRATSEAEQLAWPQHDPSAANRLSDLRARLGQRSADLEADANPQPGSHTASGYESPRR